MTQQTLSSHKIIQQLAIAGMITAFFAGLFSISPFSQAAPCTPVPPNVFCGSLTIANATLTFQDIPDSFNFGSITAGTSQDIFWASTPNQANPTYELNVLDDRASGGFTVTVDANGSFVSGGDTIPLSNLHIVTSLDETSPNNVGGVNYAAGFTGDQTISTPIYVDTDSLSLTSISTYNNLEPDSNFGNAPLVLMDGTLPLAQGRDGNMSLFTNFYVKIDSFQAAGNYALNITYTLTDSTT